MRRKLCIPPSKELLNGIKLKRADLIYTVAGGVGGGGTSTSLSPGAKWGKRVGSFYFFFFLLLLFVVVVVV